MLDPRRLRCGSWVIEPLRDRRFQVEFVARDGVGDAWIHVIEFNAFGKREVYAPCQLVEAS